MLVRPGGVSRAAVFCPLPTGTLSSALTMDRSHVIRTSHHDKAVVIAAVLLAAAVTPASAQQRYRLDQGQWKQQTVVDPASPAGKLQAIRKALAQEQSANALDMVDAWIEANPEHPLLVEAHLLKGDAMVGQGEYFKSLFDYEYVARVYPASEQFAVALEREFEVAKLFASGKKRKWLGMRILSAWGEAEELLIRIQERLPGSALGEKASLALADFYFDRREMTSASAAYDLFLQNYPRSEHRERAMLRLIHASLATFQGPQFDPTGLIDAQERIRKYEQEYPASAEQLDTATLSVRIRELLALKNQQIGDWYARRGNQVSANYMYKRVTQEYPDTAAAQNASGHMFDNIGADAEPLRGDEAAQSSPEDGS